MSTWLVVDATNYIHTHFAGTGGQYSSVDAMRGMIAEYQRRHGVDVCLCFDCPGKTWRHEIYPEYKAHRSPKDPRLIVQLADAMEYGEHEQLNYPLVPGHEADDLIAMFVAERLTAGDHVVICSRDKDLRQLLVHGRVTIMRRASQNRGEWTFEYFTSQSLEKEHRLHPAQWADYRALVGDKSDNWPGCPKIGGTTAEAILRKAGTLDVAMANLWKMPITGKQQEALLKFDWKLGRELMTLRSLPVSRAA